MRRVHFSHPKKIRAATTKMRHSTYDDGSHHWREDRSSRNRRDEERPATLGVATQAAETQGENGRKTALW
jgi:hypothetical protein